MITYVVGCRVCVRTMTMNISVSKNAIYNKNADI